MTATSCGAWAGEAVLLHDAARSRDVPVTLYEPAGCNADRPCPVVLLSPGYGVPATSYSFLAEPLRAAGHLVVAVQHDLPGDPPVPNTGDIRRDRTPAWQRGADNLRFVRQALAARLPGHAWQRVVLLGHSNGGDISSLLATQDPGFASAVVTLDHRRAPLPASSSGLRVLTLRGSDFAADPGVLPQSPAPGTCVLQLARARHDDMQDDGPAELKARLSAAVLAFLQQGRCSAPG